MTATPILQDAVTNGFYTSSITLMTTELNALASGAGVISSVNGSSSNGKFSQTDSTNAVRAKAFFKHGGTWTPAVGATLLFWLVESDDGGTTFEAHGAPASTTVAAMARPADITIAFDNVAFSSGQLSRNCGADFKLPAGSYTVLCQNNAGQTMPSTGNVLYLLPTANAH